MRILNQKYLMRMLKTKIVIPVGLCAVKRSYWELSEQKNGADYVVDLRSDTITKPSACMRYAITNAVVGDDVLQEDETVKELERRMAEITGKEAGLFVASGTMGNFLSVLSHCSRRGAEVLLSDKCHVFCAEQANIAQFGGVQPYILPTQPDGTFALEVLELRVRRNDPHYPSTELICLENTHGGIGGKILPLRWLDQVASFAAAKGIPIHVDGARVFNASVALGESVSRILSGVQSAMICFSKGLGAPIGSVIVGNEDFIHRARRLRKGIGGGWRQAGVLAAACLYALDHNVDRLKEDHNNAKLIAKGINELNTPDFRINIEDVHTNIIFFYVNPRIISTNTLAQKLLEVTEEERKALGYATSVLTYPYEPSIIRLVTHLDVSREKTMAAVAKMQFVIRSLLSSK